MEGEELAAVDFTTVEMLRVLGYKKEDTVVRTRNNLRLLTCGEFVYAKTDVCLLDLESRGQVTYYRFQLIAKAIAAFQRNNKQRAGCSSTRCQHKPYSYHPSRSFYEIVVTSELDHCRHGQCPVTHTAVYCHTHRVPRRSEGACLLSNRKLLVRCYEAFKCVALPNEGKSQTCFSYVVSRS